MSDVCNAPTPSRQKEGRVYLTPYKVPVDLGGGSTTITARFEGRCSFCAGPAAFVGEFARLAKTRTLRTGGHRRFTQYVRVALCERHSKKHREGK